MLRRVSFAPALVGGMLLMNVNSHLVMAGRAPRDAIVDCGTCNGTGAYGAGSCSVCNGRGQHRLERRHPDEQVVICNRCDGNGVVGGGICPNCNGVGQHLM